MASIKRREQKSTVSYLITVTYGVDSNGKKVRHYKTFVPPQEWSKKKQDKKAQEEAFKFEEEIKLGFTPDDKQTFAEYAEYAINTKRRAGVKESTLERYCDFLERINKAIGHIKLVDIRPMHLNKLYDDLSKEGVRNQIGMATALIDIEAELRKRDLSKKDFAELAGVNPKMVGQACKKPLNEVDANKIASALGYKMEKAFSVERDTSPLSNKTILEYHRFISSVLSLAEKEMIVPYNAAQKATPPKAKRSKPNYFQPDQVYKILDAADEEPLHYRTFINLCVVTGARRGEIAGLKWSKIDFDTNVLTIDAGLNYSKKRGVYYGSTKTEDHRSLKLPDEVITMLRQLRAEQNLTRLRNGDRWVNQDYVFTQDDGRPKHPQTWTQWLNKFSKKHDLPHINPHAFRHTAASVLIANRIDTVTVSKVLGHADPTTTEKMYSHLIDDAKAVASETLTNVLLRKKA